MHCFRHLTFTVLADIHVDALDTTNFSLHMHKVGSARAL